MGEVIIHSIDGLKPDSTYMFLIRAENIEGLSAPSRPSETIKTRPSVRRFGGVDEEMDEDEARNQLSGSDIELISTEPASSTSIRISWKVNLLIYLVQFYLCPRLL